MKAARVEDVCSRAMGGRERKGEATCPLLLCYQTGGLHKQPLPG